MLESIHVLRGLLWVVFALSAAGVIGLVVHLKRWVRAQLPPPALKARPVMTPNEEEFFGRLQRALPEYDVLAQVGMGALLTTTVSEDHPAFWELRKQFAQKIADFVVLRRGEKSPSAVVAVIELDDRTHDKRKDAERDAMLASVGIRTVRFESRAKPSEQEIRRRIAALERG